MSECFILWKLELMSSKLYLYFIFLQDLEVAADFNITVTSKDLMTKLMETDHVQVDK